LFLRCTRGLLFLSGALAVSYVALTLLHAKLYQEAAGIVLEKQISVQQQHGVTTHKEVAKQGDVLGRIEILRLGLTIAILEGTSAQTLRLGVGHIQGTALPGEPGNSGIAGHRDTFFRPLKDIRTSDEIQIQTATGISRYQVDWVRVVAPDDTGILTSSASSSITLITCYPFHLIGAAPERFVVHAHEE
jgi:LPXTG-site transpeptidase (sortase) family protein